MGHKGYIESNQTAFSAMIRHKLIRTTVTDLLKAAGVTEAPVDVRTLARLQGAVVVEEPLSDGDFSGFLYTTRTSPPVIGVNSTHHENRKRFTVAHELGHLMLHPKDGIHMDEAVIQRRDEEASTGTNDEEIEANRFAAELLMPRQFLEADIPEMGKFFLDDDQQIQALATRYQVSVQAMTIRLSTLGFITF